MKCLWDFAALAVVYAFLFPYLRRRGRWALRSGTALYLYLSAALYVVLMPVLASIPDIGSHPYVPMALAPFDDLICCYGGALRQIVLNVLLTVPFGFLLPCVSQKFRFGKTVLTVFLCSVGVELLQPLLSPRRISDITDVITNTAGGVLGWLLFLLFEKRIRSLRDTVDGCGNG